MICQMISRSNGSMVVSGADPLYTLPAPDSTEKDDDEKNQDDESDEEDDSEGDDKMKAASAATGCGSGDGKKKVKSSDIGDRTMYI